MCRPDISLDTFPFISLDIIILFPAFTGRFAHQHPVGKRVVGDLLCIPVEYQLAVQSLRQNAKTEHLAERAGYFERRAGFLFALTSQKEIRIMVRRALRYFRQLRCHLFRFLFRDDRQCTAMRASFEGQRLGVNLFSRIQFGRLNVSVLV